MSDNEFLDPTDSVAVPRKVARRLESLDGKTITLLDISKAKGNHLLVATLTDAGGKTAASGRKIKICS